MGDVVHAMPALSDMRRALPGLVVDWLVEQPFAAIPALHPGVDRVLPLAWRKWRKRLRRRETWAAWALRAKRREPDLVLDLQGLLKSAFGRARSGLLAGYDRVPCASRGIGWRSAAVPRDCMR
jgi:heptosyltransferase-1